MKTINLKCGPKKGHHFLSFAVCFHVTVVCACVCAFTLTWKLHLPLRTASSSVCHWCGLLDSGTYTSFLRRKLCLSLFMTLPPPALDEREEEVSWAGVGVLSGNGHTAFHFHRGSLRATVTWSRLQAVLEERWSFILALGPDNIRDFPAKSLRAQSQTNSLTCLYPRHFPILYLGMSTRTQFVR